MSDTVVVVGDEETETEPAAELAPEVPAETAGEVAAAVTDAMIAGATVAAASVPDQGERSSADQRIDGLVTQVAELTATVAALVPTVQRAADTADDAQSAAAAAVAVTVEDDAESDDDDHDTITPDRRHPWFRRFSEWRA